MRTVLVLTVCAAVGGWNDGATAAEPPRANAAATVHAVAATPVERMMLAQDFRAELLYSVPSELQGSWVNMTVAPRGRLIVSDQHGALYRVTPGKSAADTRVEKLSLAIGSAQGLLCAWDSLYVTVNGDAAAGSGLYRVRDTNGDDEYDEIKLLRKFRGAGEHGPHAVILGPDGQSLYVCAGNHTDLPELGSSRVPQRWQEDHLLPRMWDAGGHAVGKLAPGGWVCRTDPAGNSFELVSIGFRNEYDVAFNTRGELFTYDADMEWDIGSPWYRPTRVCHVTSGSEFGWRSGTGKWPAYYADSLPAAVDVGPGSPTGIVFGTGARFPARYQQALFICDWSYGLLYAVHLTPDGASYRGEFERFATASPLPLTDVVINPHDGAMYFTIGGRKTQSGLYRVTYVGAEPTTPAAGPALTTEAELRRQLEALHVRGADPAVIDAAWPHLSHADRFIRFAARTAIEQQPAASWRERAVRESNPAALIELMMALARCGDDDAAPEIVAALGRLTWEQLNEQQQLAAVRAYSLAFVRHGAPAPEARRDLLAKLDARFPAASPLVNRELSQLLIYLDAPNIVPRTMALLRGGATQEEQIHYAFILRNARTGWTPELRREYFGWYVAAGRYRGGHSFLGFLRNMRQDAAATLDDRARAELGGLVEASLEARPLDADQPARPLVKEWQTTDLLADVSGELQGRDFARGRQMFAAAACFKCHRFQGDGGIIGPDLSGVGKRFTYPYLLESLTEPNKVVSDQYQATVFELDDGRSVVGKVANLNANQLMVVTNMLEPGNLTSIDVAKIASQTPSPVSMMPGGTVNTLSREEILDLLAYLKSGGDPGHEAFRR